MQVKEQSTMAQVAKTQPKKKNAISRADRKKLVIAHYQMYRAMFYKCLISGLSIGASSHSAFRYVEAKLSTMDRNNPVTKFLLRLNKHRSKRIAKRIMPSRNRDARIGFMPYQQKNMELSIPKWINKSLNVFNTLAERYKQNTTKTTQKNNKHILDFLTVVADPRAFVVNQQNQHGK